MLTYDTLRQANKLRLPQFKNKHGEAAHARPDGSDWTFETWLMATMGELGEAAQVRIDLESKQITFSEYEENISNELADVAIYLDLLSLRALDVPLQDEDFDLDESSYITDARLMMLGIATLGSIANDCKKFYRGDMALEEYKSKKENLINKLIGVLAVLKFSDNHKGLPARATHADGVNLGKAIVKKFNIVSERVKSSVTIVDGMFVSGIDYYIVKEN